MEDGYAPNRNIDLSKDRKAMDAVADKQIVKSEKEDKLANIFPHTDRLEIKWFDVKGKKYFTICCECGCNKLLVVKLIRGLRCTECGLFHSWLTWTLLREKVHKLASFNDGLITKIEQPNDGMKKLNRKICYDVKNKTFTTKPKTLEDLKATFRKKLC